MKRTRWIFAHLWLAAMLVALPAQASLDMFLDLGTDIPGESKSPLFKDKVDVLAWTWAMSNPATIVGGGGGTTAGKVSFQDLSLTKYVDKASPLLMLRCAKGDHIPTATLIVRKASGASIDYIRITLSEVLVTSISTGGSGGEERLTENITLNFAKVKFEYFPEKADGTADKAIPFEWDLVVNKAP